MLTSSVLDEQPQEPVALRQNSPVVFAYEAFAKRDLANAATLVFSGVDNAYTRVGVAGSFTGASSISLGDPAFLDFGGADFGLEVLFRITSAASGSTRMELLSKDSATGRQFIFEINPNGDGSSNNAIGIAWFNGGSITQQVSGVSAITTNALHHLLVERVGNSVSMVLDGVPLSVSNGSNHTGWVDVVGTSTTAYIGRREYSGFEDYLTGGIVFARVLSRSLTPAERAETYRSFWWPYERTAGAIPFGEPASGATGTSATTNANDTSAASGTTTVVGTSATTNAADTSSASGSVGSAVSGGAATTNANDTAAAAGTTTVTGTAATTNAADTSAAVGTTSVLGTAAPSNANDTATASGAAGSITGTAAYENRNDTATAFGVAGAQIIVPDLGGGNGRARRFAEVERAMREQLQQEEEEVMMIVSAIYAAGVLN